MNALMIAHVASMIDHFNIPNIKLLIELGYSVHVACNFKSGSSCDDAEINDLKSKLDALGVTYTHIDFERSPFSLKNITAYKQLKRLFNVTHFDLVHCHTPMGGVLARLAARKYRKQGTKVIYTAHGFHFFKGAPLKNWLLYYPVEWLCAFWTDELITINKEDYARAKKHMHAKHITYIPGVGVDLNKFSPGLFDENAKKNKLNELGIQTDKFILLSVGELQERKNHIVVINALCELKNPNIVYLIAGVGELHDKYQEIIDKHGMSDNIKLLGYRTDISDLCEIADCFVHPSIREGLGIAPLEAMACGLPLISADINGIKDYTKDGETGCCVNPRSVDEMKKAIMKMFEDKDFRDKCGRNNVQAVKKFNILETQNIMNELYSNFARGGKNYKYLNRLIYRQKLYAELNISLEDTTLVSVGELNKNKNHEVVIRALAKLNDVSIHYVIAGTGELYDYLKKLANELGISEQVHLLGYRSDVADLYKAADVCVFPSIREGLGLAAIEGMASGLPLICSDNRGTRDYAVNSENAFVCDFHSVDDFSCAIRKTVGSKKTMYEMGLVQQSICKKFDITTVTAIMTDVYKQYTD